MYLQQFKDLSSWREDTLTVKAKSVGTLDFMDTKPNQFVIQNGNHYPVYIGIGSTPNSKNYEFKIGANSNDVFGRPTPTSKVMFYNDSDMDIVVRVFSIFQEFDIITLKNMTASIQNATVVTDGIVRGFEQGVKLPSGDNLIGKVELLREQFQTLENMCVNIENIKENSILSSEELEKIYTNISNNQRELVGNLSGTYIHTKGNYDLRGNGVIKSLTIPGANVENNDKYIYELVVHRLELENKCDETIDFNFHNKYYKTEKGTTLVIEDETFFYQFNVAKPQYVFDEYTPIESHDTIYFFIDNARKLDWANKQKVKMYVELSVYRTLKKGV